MEEEAITGDLRYFKDLTNQKREISSCYYSLRENPKKKTQKSPEVMTKKVLFRCDECGKGFRYEKSFTNHLKAMHLPTNQQVYEESINSLFKSFSLVRKKKRSRLIRNKRTSFSFSFLESPSSVVAVNDEEFEVADCLIFLSKSTPKVCSYESSCLGIKFLRKDGEFDSGFLSNEQRLLLQEEGIITPVTFKEPMNVLGHSCVLVQQKHELEQQKLCKAGDFESGFCRTELGVGIDSDVKMITESDEKNVEHQCKLCKKIFPSYQALGGHQTFHRIRKCQNKKNCREETVEPDQDESLRCSVTKRRRGNHCSIGSRNLSWVHALGEVSLQEATLVNRG